MKKSKKGKQNDVFNAFDAPNTSRESSE